MSLNPILAGTSNEQLKRSVDCALRNILQDQYERADELVLIEATTAPQLDDEAGASATKSPLGESSKSFNGSTSGSLTDRSGHLSAGTALQRELNKARELFPSTPAEMASKHRKIVQVFEKFSTLVATHVEEHVCKMIACNLFCHGDDEFLKIVGSGNAAVSAVRNNHNRGGHVASAKGLPANAPRELHEFRESFANSASGVFCYDGVRYINVLQAAGLGGHRDQIKQEILDELRINMGPAAVAEKTWTPQEDDWISLLAMERVRKTAHREVKARRDVLSLYHIESYCQVPLCAAVDFFGLTFFAEVDLQFSHKTSQGGLYQSIDQQFGRGLTPGEAIHGTRIADHINRALGVCFSLKLHPKGGSSSYGPVDLQVHVASDDGTIYTRCCRRLLPPVLTLHGARKPPMSVGANSSFCQIAGRRLLPNFLDLFGDQQCFSSDVWLDEPSRSTDGLDLEAITINHVLHDRAIPEVAEVLFLIDFLWREEFDMAPTSILDTLPARQQTTSIHDIIAAACRWRGRLTVETLKELLHHYGVNICFLGRVLEHLETLLWHESKHSIDFPSTLINALAASIAGPASTGNKKIGGGNIVAVSMGMKLEKPNLEIVRSTAFVERHEALQLVRVEMFARATRVVVCSEVRRYVAAMNVSAMVEMFSKSHHGDTSHNHNKPSSSSSTTSTIKAHREKGKPSARSSAVLLSLFAQIKHEVRDFVCDVLSRCSGELLSSQANDDRALWEEQILPMVSNMFGVVCPFVRSEASTSSLSKPVNGEGMGLSTASRVRSRSHRSQEGRGEFVGELSTKAMKLAAVDFATWGALKDEAFPHTIPREAKSMRITEKALRQGMPKPPVATDGVHGSLIDGSQIVATNEQDNILEQLAEFITVPLPTVRRLRKEWERVDAVRMGAAQDYRIVRRACQMLGCWIERRDDSASGVSAIALPFVVSLCARPPFEATTLKMLATGSLKRVEQDLLDELKANKQTQSPGTSDSIHLRSYYRIALAYLLGGSLSQASEWFRKSRDLLIRDIGNNELGQGMMMLQESRVELIRKRYQEAIDAANHSLGVIQNVARESQLFPQVMMAVLDSVDSSGSSSAAMRARKSELARQLVPYCRRFGLAVGRVAARDAITRLYSNPLADLAAEEEQSSRPNSRNKQRGRTVTIAAAEASPQAKVQVVDPAVRTQLAAACLVVLREQGLDPEAAMFSIHLLLATQIPIFLPLAAALSVHAIPVTSSLYKTAIEKVTDALYDTLHSTATRFPELVRGANITLPMLSTMVSLSHAKLREPHLLLAYHRQYWRSHLNQLSTESSAHNMTRIKTVGSFTKEVVREGAKRGIIDEGEDEEDNSDALGHFYLVSDKNIVLGQEDSDSLVLHTMLYFAKQWALGLFRAVPPENKTHFSKWDLQTANSYGDLVNAAKHFSDLRPDIGIQLNQMMASLFDEIIMPKGMTRAGSSRELLVRDSTSSSALPVQTLILSKQGYRLRSAQLPTCPLSLPFLPQLYHACSVVIKTQIDVLGLTVQVPRGAHILEDDPRKEPQLEWCREIFIAGEVMLETLAGIRSLYRYCGSGGSLSFWGPQMVQQQSVTPFGAGNRASSLQHTTSTLFTFQSLAARNALATAPPVAHHHSGGASQQQPVTTTVPVVEEPHSILQKQALSVDAMDRVLAIFTPTQANQNAMLHLLHSLKKSLMNSSFIERVELIAKRFTLQRADVWHCYFRDCVALYEAEVELTAPMYDSQSTTRTEAQLKELTQTLKAIVTRARKELGAVPNQEEYEHNLDAMAKRIQQQQGQLLQQQQQQQLQQSTALVIDEHEDEKESRDNGRRSVISASRSSSVFSVQRASPSISDLKGTPSVAAAVPLQPPVDEAYFHVHPREVVQGGVIRVQWCLPTKVPLRFGGVGVFSEDSCEILTSSRATEMHKGLQFRAWKGHEELRAPMRTGTYVFAFFATGHSEGLPLEGFVQRVRVTQRLEHGPLPLLEREVRRLEASMLREEVVALPVSEGLFAPCDSLKARREREEAQIRRTLLAQRHDPLGGKKSNQTAKALHLKGGEKRDMSLLDNESSLLSRSYSFGRTLSPIPNAPSPAVASHSMLSSSAPPAASSSVVCKLQKNHTTIAVVVRDEDRVQETIQKAEDKYRKNIRSIKGTLESMGTKVVLVGSGLNIAL